MHEEAREVPARVEPQHAPAVPAPSEKSADTDTPVPETGHYSNDPGSVFAPRVHTALRGAVISAARGDPVDGVEVTLHLDDRDAHATTDVRGAFDMDLVGPTWVFGATCRATVNEGTTTRFDGLVRLDQDLVLAVGDIVELRGHIESNRDLAGETIAVAVDSDDASVEKTRHHLARTLVGTDGALEPNQFVLSVAFDEPRSDVRLRVTVGERVERTYVVPYAELVSIEGARVELELATLHVQVADELGWPIAGATVHAAALDDTSGECVAVGKSDATGAVTLDVAAAQIEVCVAAPERAFRVEYVDASALDPILTVTLARLVNDDRWLGRVMYDDGAPVKDARVAAAPNTVLETVGRAAQVDETAPASGCFELSLAGNTPLRLSARSHSRGVEAEQLAARQSEEQILLLPRCGSLRVNVDTGALPGPFRGAALDYVLVERESRAVLSGRLWSTPFEIARIPQGTYDVFVVLRGLAGCADSVALVDAERASVLELVARPLRRIDGRVHAANGAPYAGGEVTALARWPEEAARLLCSSRIGSDGSFSVVSDVERAELAVRYAGQVVATRAARAGEFADLTLP